MKIRMTFCAVLTICSFYQHTHTHTKLVQMRLQRLGYLLCPRRHSLPIKCVLNPASTERTSPPCSCLKTTGADPRIRRTSWALQRYWRVTSHAQMKKRDESSFAGVSEGMFVRLDSFKDFWSKKMLFSSLHIWFTASVFHHCHTLESCSMKRTQHFYS